VSETYPIVFVCGASDYHNALVMGRVLDTHTIALLIIGNRPGADRLAKRWARRTATHVDIVPALPEFGDGPERWRGLLVALLQADRVLVFGSDEVSQMIVDEAQSNGICVDVIDDEDYLRRLPL
jgi:hypothetical protein